MKKILTAINNPKLNEELKKENKFEIIGKDIQYKEAILEILEKNNNIDLIILSEKIPGEIELEKLIKKIKLINKKIKLIFILEKENNDLEKILIKNNIIDFYYNNKINLNELIKIINKKEINMEEEIIRLKKIIEEKDKNNNLLKNKNIINYISKIKNKIIKINNSKKEINFKENNNGKDFSKIITFSGNNKSGKTTISLMVSRILSEKNNKVLLIDGDFEKQDLSIILKYKENIKFKKLKNKTNKFFYKNKKKFKKYKLINNKKNIKLINLNKNIIENKIKKIINLFTIKINKNFYYLKEINYVLKNKNKNEKEIKEVMEYLFDKLKTKYKFIIIDLSKSDSDDINKEILKISDINFIIMEANLLGINEAKKLVYKYKKYFNINSEEFNLIINKNNLNSINKNLISKIIPIKNKIYKIRKNKKINININNFFKIKNKFINKKIKKEINKIIYDIENKF